MSSGRIHGNPEAKLTVSRHIGQVASKRACWETQESNFNQVVPSVCSDCATCPVAPGTTQPTGYSGAENITLATYLIVPITPMSNGSEPDPVG